jgi:hypothetical protein
MAILPYGPPKTSETADLITAIIAFGWGIEIIYYGRLDSRPPMIRVRRIPIHEEQNIAICIQLPSLILVKKTAGEKTN